MSDTASLQNLTSLGALSIFLYVLQYLTYNFYSIVSIINLNIIHGLYLYNIWHASDIKLLKAYT